jgi:hypothetical protein
MRAPTPSPRTHPLVVLAWITVNDPAEQERSVRSSPPAPTTDVPKYAQW